MMEPLADHWGFVLAAYGFTAAVIAALISYAAIDYRAQLATLARLERAGHGRRSEARAFGRAPEPAQPSSPGEAAS